MKKLFSTLLVAVLAAGILAGCSSDNKADKSSSTAESKATSSTAANTDSSASENATELKKLKIGASVTPHAEILAKANELLKEKGYELEIVEFTDYIQPNLALESKDLDANYFQHITYLNNFNEEHGTHLASAAEIHYEPFGLFAGKTSSLDDLQDGATIAVPNDTTNEARALLLLQDLGLIKLKEDAGITATQIDIVENPKNLVIQEVEAVQTARTLQDVDMAVINGNYALSNNLKIEDAIATESSDSLAATAYVNVIAVREGDENREDIKALVDVLKSDEISQFIADTYKGAVVATK
ncbi:MetQ/NlpA family ABC transporter substrate-binding protein [Scatolibacter rhodanostii]|uniref:MetQ/NlpA family ABC transporter substrate-binding protein n=1 Tax=Scatolibacter rhodanostii TaxID=2014781 RepID=UPI000C06AE94|nr:MetQ/NlpA family ABC transporter substrate-binding protein [Scatolibacter rhodanostii]